MASNISGIRFRVAKTFSLYNVVKEKKQDKGQKVNASPQNKPTKKLQTNNSNNPPKPQTNNPNNPSQSKIKKKLEYTDTNEGVVTVLLVKSADFRASQSMLAKTWSLWMQCIEYLTESALSKHYFANNWSRLAERAKQNQADPLGAQAYVYQNDRLQ